MVEKLRRITEYSEEEEKCNYLCAIHEWGKLTLEDERFEKRLNKNEAGLPIATLMEKFVLEEQERKEADRRCEERSAPAMNVQRQRNQLKNPRKPSPDHREKRKPLCLKCGHSLDGHTTEMCPNQGKI